MATIYYSVYSCWTEHRAKGTRMTAAVCFRCGEWKFGSFTRCRNCGSVPISEDDLIVSMILAEDRMGPAELETFRESIKFGNGIVLDEPSDSELRKAARQHLNIIGRQRPAQGGSHMQTAPADRPTAGGNLLLSAGLRFLGLGLGLIQTAFLIGVVALLYLIGIVHTDPTDDWPSFLWAFCPPATVAFVYLALNICRFENQRWARNFGGASNFAAALVEITAGIAWLFSWAWLVGFLYDHGWQQTIGLMVISQMAVLIWSSFSRDHLILWLAATLILWVLIALLSVSVSWFGLIGS